MLGFFFFFLKKALRNKRNYCLVVVQNNGESTPGKSRSTSRNNGVEGRLEDYKLKLLRGKKACHMWKG